MLILKEIITKSGLADITYGFLGQCGERHRPEQSEDHISMVLKTRALENRAASLNRKYQFRDRINGYFWKSGLGSNSVLSA